MRTTFALIACLLAILLTACSAERIIGETIADAANGGEAGTTTGNAESSTGATGAPSATTETGGGESAPDGGFGGAAMVVDDTASDRYCRVLLDYQDAGGFWCEFDDAPGGAGSTGTFGEADDPAECRWCYLARCGADGFIYWVPVECSGL